MEEKPTYEELENRIKDLENIIEMMKQSEKDMLIQMHRGEKPGECEQDFESLDEEDMKYVLADEKIRILEEYEYYLSASSPLANSLNNAISEFPILEPVLSKILGNLLRNVDDKMIEPEIIECLIDFLRDELKNGNTA